MFYYHKQQKLLYPWLWNVKQLLELQQHGSTNRPLSTLESPKCSQNQLSYSERTEAKPLPLLTGNTSSTYYGETDMKLDFDKEPSVRYTFEIQEFDAEAPAGYPVSKNLSVNFELPDGSSWTHVLRQLALVISAQYGYSIMDQIGVKHLGDEEFVALSDIE